MAAERQERWPALAGSALLHAALLAGALVVVSKPPKPIELTQSVPVTVVASGPTGGGRLQPRAEPTPTPPRPAPAPTPAPPPPAPKPEPAPEPVPAPRPEPKPTPRPPPPPPPKPAPIPKPVPAPKPPPKAAPVAKAQPKPRPDLNLDALASSLPKSHAKRQDLDLGALASSLPSAKAAKRQDLNLDDLANSLGSRAATKGPPRAAATASTGLTAGEKGALRAKLNRLWNVNCSIPGAGSVVVKMRMRLNASGGLAGPPSLVNASGDAPAAVTQAAVTRAASAIARGAPFLEISPEHLRALTDDFVVNFDAHATCGGG